MPKFSVKKPLTVFVAVLGVLILGVLSNGMQLIGMGTYTQYVVKGLVLLAAVGFDTYQKYSAMKVKKAA